MLNRIKSFFVLLIVFFSFLTINCKQNIKSVSITITSPYSSWLYSNETPILFSCVSDSTKILWESSIDGIIGNGNQIISSLTSGYHKIIVKELNHVYKDGVIFVDKMTNISYKSIMRSFYFC